MFGVRLMRREQIVKLKNVLPEIPGINGSEEYFKAAVLVLLVLLDEEYHLVFQKRVLNIRQGGEICFPGGHFDPGIDPDFEHTAIRDYSSFTDENGNEIFTFPAREIIWGSTARIVYDFIRRVNLI
jgi:hypothetical protein